MKRGEVTTVEKLIPGDRFYKQSSKDKKPFQLIAQESHGKYEVCGSDKMINGFPSNKSSIQIFRGTTTVVYLRNINDVS